MEQEKIIAYDQLIQKYLKSQVTGSYLTYEELDALCGEALKTLNEISLRVENQNIKRLFSDLESFRQEVEKEHQESLDSDR